MINNNELVKKEAVRKVTFFNNLKILKHKYSNIYWNESFILNHCIQIIDAMTRGKDVSMLFTDVLRNMITKNMELKKLIYLYIINYAKSKPELVILAINAFRNVNNNRLIFVNVVLKGCK